MGNYSKQREKILKIIEKMNSIPTAEEICFEVKKVDSTINQSTVYRYLNYLVKNNLMLKIPSYEGADRFFYNKANKDYGFISCIKCGKIQKFICDFDLLNFENSIFRQTNTRVIKKEMIIKGICEDCILNN